MSSDSNRKRSAKTAKTPKKPRADFPLSIHKGTGYWCKKVRGHVFYFGKVADDPKGKAALELWLDQKDDLLAGREPRARTKEGLTVADLANHFLTHKEQLRDNGELNPRTFQTYYATCATVVKVFKEGRVVSDLVPDDFRKLRVALAKTRGAVALRNEMQRVRSLFKFAFDEGLILAPIRFGQAFAKPKLETVRRNREDARLKHGERMYEARDIQLILATAKEPLRTMVLLAANCGFGQTDLSSLPTRAVDLKEGWVNFPRPKTAVPRRIPLWPETIEAIARWLTIRPEPKAPGDADCLFLTVRGQRWVKVCATGSPADAIGQEFGKVIRRLNLQRPGRSFYALRHGFETIAGETTDQVSVDSIMGHVPHGMAGQYRERIGDDRLRAVVDHVRTWLLAAHPEKPPGGYLGGDICEPCVLCEREGDDRFANPQNPQDSGQNNLRDEPPELRLFAG